jgi:hypothetical protein
LVTDGREIETKEEKKGCLLPETITTCEKYGTLSNKNINYPPLTPSPLHFFLHLVNVFNVFILILKKHFLWQYSTVHVLDLHLLPQKKDQV